MKVLQLHAGYRTPAGEDTVVMAEAQALRDAGHEVEQLIEQNPASVGLAVRALARSGGNRDVARRVSELCRDFDPDIVHIHNTWFALSSAAIDAAHEARRPVVMTVHNYRLGCIRSDLFRGSAICTSCVGRSPLQGVVHGCYRDSRPLSAIAAVEVSLTRRRRRLTKVDRFVAPSEFLADRLIEIGLPPSRLTVKPHFTSDPGSRTAAPSTSDEVLYIGRLAAAKGIQTLLRAWERSSSSPDRRLTVIGDGPDARQARESAPRGVQFTGWLSHDEVRARMLTARAFVFPSEWYEPFGMVLIEAMAAGLPVITTTASDAARITDSPAGLVAPAGDEHALARALEQLTDDLVDEVGAAGRRRFHSTYAEAAGVEAMEHLYRDVIDEYRQASR